METSNVNRLIAEAVARHGIRLDPDDPAVVVVTLSRLMLEEASERVAAEIRAASRELQDAAAKVEAGLGAALARELRRDQARGQQLWWVTQVTLGLLIMFFGVLVGRGLQ
jgi:hypothetical protein